MNRKSIWIAGFAAIFAVSMITASNAFIDVSGETSEKPKVPRYSETCAHGHNGYDCKTPKHRIDISELQQRADDLEKRVSQLERSR
ncbi:MAG: hypothetical protein J4F36_11075 [Nitrosopumilaceae archaeon]|nr:hypothetical protein [Nitrosopumilaceae archaeon]